MSIGNKLCFCVLILFLSFTTSASALKLTFLEGGLPFADISQLIEEGIRLGDVHMLRLAWEQCEKSIKLSGATTTNVLDLGRIFFNLSLLGDSTNEDFEFAENVAKELIEQYPQDSDAQRALGLILAGRGAYLDAFDKLLLALQLNPANEFVIYDLATLHVALHQPQNVISVLESKNLNSSWGYVVLAMAWIQQNCRGRAILALYRARHKGLGNYWVEQMLNSLSLDLKLPLN